MFYQQNLNPNDSHHQLSYSSLQSDDLPSPKPQQYQSFNDCDVYNIHEPLSHNQFQIFGNESFHTISRISLQMLPDPYAMEINQQNFQLAHKHSNSSIYMGSENEDEIDLETKLVTQTRQLSIDQNKQDNNSQFQYNSFVSSQKEISKHWKSSKIFTTKRIKNLLKEIKRRYKYQEKLKGSFKIKIGQQILQLNEGCIRPILQKKATISGMIIENNEKKFKLRVNTELLNKTQIYLQFWREVEQNWVQAVISAKLQF